MTPLYGLEGSDRLQFQQNLSEQMEETMARHYEMADNLAEMLQEKGFAVASVKDVEISDYKK